MLFSNFVRPAIGLAVAGFCFHFFDQAIAAPVTLGSESFDLPVPAGYCTLSKENPSDKLLIEEMESGNAGQNQVLLVFAQCDKVDALRANSDFSAYHVGAWLAQLDPSTKKPLGIGGLSASDYIAQMTQVLSFGDTQSKTADTLPQRAGEIAEKFKVSGTPFQVIVSGPGELYFAVMVGGTESIAGVASVALANGHSVSVNMYRPYTEPNDFVALYELAHQAIETLKVNQAASTDAAAATPAEPSSVEIAPSGATEVAETAETENSPWIWWVIGGVAVVIIIGVIGFALTRNKRATM